MDRKPKPTSPGRRFVTYPDYAEVTRTEPEKSLVEGLKEVRRAKLERSQDGTPPRWGAKRLYRKIDFKPPQGRRTGEGRPVEYDPIGRHYIALLHYADGEKRYILALQAAARRRHSRVRCRADIRVVIACRWPTCPPARSSTTSS